MRRAAGLRPRRKRALERVATRGPLVIVTFWQCLCRDDRAEGGFVTKSCFDQLRAQLVGLARQRVVGRPDPRHHRRQRGAKRSDQSRRAAAAGHRLPRSKLFQIIA